VDKVGELLLLLRRGADVNQGGAQDGRSEKTWYPNAKASSLRSQFF